MAVLYLYYDDLFFPTRSTSCLVLVLAPNFQWIGVAALAGTWGILFGNGLRVLADFANDAMRLPEDLLSTGRRPE